MKRILTVIEIVAATTFGCVTTILFAIGALNLIDILKFILLMAMLGPMIGTMWIIKELSDDEEED